MSQPKTNTQPTSTTTPTQTSHLNSTTTSATTSAQMSQHPQFPLSPTASAAMRWHYNQPQFMRPVTEASERARHERIKKMRAQVDRLEETFWELVARGADKEAFDRAGLGVLGLEDEEEGMEGVIDEGGGRMWRLLEGVLGRWRRWGKGRFRGRGDLGGGGVGGEGCSRMDCQDLRVFRLKAG